MSDLVTTRVFSDGEKGITATKMNDIIGGASVQTDFVATKPTTSTVDVADQMLVLKAAGTYARAPFQTVVDSVNANLPSSDSEIWSVRLRSFNSVGNPNFEVDQRNIFNGATNPTNNVFIQDRWIVFKAGVTLTGNWNSSTQGVYAPGSTTFITKNYLRFSLLTQQASLASGDIYGVYQAVEGTQWRELMGDVTSISLLVRSTVANLKFSVSFRDSPPTKSLVKLCTIPAANVWTLISLPNIPIAPVGNFGYIPGVPGYQLLITLCAGPNLIAPAADTWQSGIFAGAPGMSNFAASPVNSTFDIAFVQHEPGAVCSQFMDKPFVQNYDECLRYFSKSYAYVTKPGTATQAGASSIYGVNVVTQLFNRIAFSKVMAKTPTVLIYEPNGGAVNSVWDYSGATGRGVSNQLNLNEMGFSGLTLTTTPVSNAQLQFQYTADTTY